MILLPSCEQNWQDSSGTEIFQQSSDTNLTETAVSTETPEIISETSVFSELTDTTEIYSDIYTTVPVSENPYETITESTDKIRKASELYQIFEDTGHSTEEISSSQIITVISDGDTCSVSCFEYNSEENDWIKDICTKGYVGKNGTSSESCEGDYKTPAGIFSLGFAFGTENESFKYPYRIINDNCYWVDDPDSELYNQWVESENITWKSAEHLIDYPDSYKYSVAINYNTNPVIPGAGSAIFLHCSNGSFTAGCVSVPETDMLSVLNWLDPEANPVILIS